MKKTIPIALFLIAAIVLTGLPAFGEDRIVHVKVRTDKEETGFEAFKAMDGKPDSYWHSGWRKGRTPHPHEIVVDLGATYEISGFTYVPSPSCIKDYEVYLSDRREDRVPLAQGTPIAKGTFTKEKEENVVKFNTPAKGRYFRLRSLSEMKGHYMGSIAELRLHCAGVKFTTKPWSVGANYPKAGKDVIALIEGFPLLAKLLEMKNPWSWDPIVLKSQLFPEGMEPFPGSGDPPAVFVNRPAVHDWHKMTWQQVAEEKPVDSLGLKVWNYRAYETNYYAVKSASPFIRLHMGRPQLEWVNNMTTLYPALPQLARKGLPAKMDKIVAALAPYGAKKLPMHHNSQQYLLPGGTKMSISDYTTPNQPGYLTDEVRMKIDFEPAAPPKGREMLPLFASWRVADRRWEGASSVLGHLESKEVGRPAPATGKEAARQWSDRPTGFASVNAMGQNGTTGGAGGKVVTVTNLADLEKYAQMKEPYIIRVKGAITVTPKGKEIRLASDKTIIGVGKTGEIVQGGFFIGRGAHNVILRNLSIRDTFMDGDWDGLKNDWDGLQLDGAHHIWVDHCHFSRHGDGCIDSRKGTTYFTVSWCVFSDHNKTFGCGWDVKATAQLTLHHNWFRNTACRVPAAGQVLRAHYYNNRYQNVGAYGHLVLYGTNLLAQNCLFENVNRPLHRVDGTCTIVSVGNVFRSTRDKHDVWGRAFFDPSRFYPYPLDKAEDLPGLLDKYSGPQENIGQ